MNNLTPPPLEGYEYHAYLAGPMTGIKGFNFEAFLAVDELIWREYRWKLFNPARHEIEAGVVPWPGILEMEGSIDDLAKMTFNKDEALLRDMGAIAKSRFGTILMPGWEASSGARLEALATLWVGKKLYEAYPLVGGGVVLDVISSQEAFHRIYAQFNG